MKIAIDVQYEKNSALAAGIIFEHWESDIVFKKVVKEIKHVEPYEPGSFYKRELPCILALLEIIPETLDTIIIDGFVTLGANHADGLGMHLYRALDEAIPIIGVAKKSFKDTPKDCEIFRGHSSKALYVTSVGIDNESAKNFISKMHGRFRLPTLLKMVDQLCRGSCV